MTQRSIDHMARNIAKTKGMTLAQARAAVRVLMAMRERRQVQTADQLHPRGAGIPEARSQ